MKRLESWGNKTRGSESQPDNLVQISNIEEQQKQKEIEKLQNNLIIDLLHIRTSENENGIHEIIIKNEKNKGNDPIDFFSTKISRQLLHLVEFFASNDVNVEEFINQFDIPNFEVPETVTVLESQKEKLLSQEKRTKNEIKHVVKVAFPLLLKYLDNPDTSINFESTNTDTKNLDQLLESFSDQLLRLKRDQDQAPDANKVINLDYTRSTQQQNSNPLTEDYKEFITNYLLTQNRRNQSVISRPKRS